MDGISLSNNGRKIGRRLTNRYKSRFPLPLTSERAKHCKMNAILFIMLALLCFSQVTVGDYWCNCYCPTINTFAGYGQISSTSTFCDPQRCANACYYTFPQCGIRTTWGWVLICVDIPIIFQSCCRQCRNDGHRYVLSTTSLIVGLATAFVIKSYWWCTNRGRFNFSM